LKEIVVLSGKGGTGKTSLVASLATLAERPVLADCDVDAADLRLVLEPEIIRSGNFTGGKKAQVIPEKCTGCGKCFDLCRFGAVIESGDREPVYTIDPISCEGCGVCSYFCPAQAIRFEPAVNGRWFISRTRYGPMVHARLGVAEENSGKLVSLVRKEARAIAGEEKANYLIVDGPPGIGCPVIASITGADAVLIVTEPTVSGAHDLERVAELTGHFKIPAYLCINKFDLNPAMSKRIEKRASARGIKMVGGIHYDRVFTAAQIKRMPVALYTEAAVAGEIRNVWRELARAVD